MDFSDPFVGLTPGRKLNKEEIMRALRIDIAAELDAINLYQAHIDAIDDERVTQVIAHIRDEEKEHVAEFIAILNYLDLTQEQKFAMEQISEIERGQTGAIAEGDQMPESEQVSAGPSTGGQLTVGSLLGEEQG